MRYKTKTKDCVLTVKAKASWGEEIDEKALDSFARIYLKGFLKPRVTKKNVVEYTGPIGVSLYERLKNPISKRDFLFIMEQVAVAVQKIQNNKLNMKWVVLDLHYVFINKITKEIQFLYLPVSRKPENTDVVAFIESIVYSVTPAAEKDTEYVSRFIHFLKGQKNFKPERLEAYIEREDRSVVNIIRKQNIGQSGFLTGKQRHYYEHYDQKDNEEATDLLNDDGSENHWTDDDTDLLSGSANQWIGDDNTGLLDGDGFTNQWIDDDNTGLLSDSANQWADDDNTGLLGGSSSVNQGIEEATGLLCGDDEDGTSLLNGWQSVHYPSLFRVLTEETVSVNKPVFRLGKERSYVDYFVTNNNAVSRSHADIITRGNKYFVIDLNSKNHTYINDRIVAVHSETELHDGDYLKLGNEVFIFRV